MRIPIGPSGLVLRVREPWPRTSKVYCHRAGEGEWHDELEVVEDVGVRKSLADLAGSLVDGGLAFQMADLAAHPRAAVVVEDRYSALFRHEHVKAGFLADLVAQLQARYPTVPIVFCETRQLAEEWTFRFLGASLAQHLDDPEDPTAPRDWR